jgi:hypothetical protein
MDILTRFVEFLKFFLTLALMFGALATGVVVGLVVEWFKRTEYIPRKLCTTFMSWAFYTWDFRQGCPIKLPRKPYSTIREKGGRIFGREWRREYYARD